MPYLRYYHARNPYNCALCSCRIVKGQGYFRDEPHPWRRMRGEAAPRQLCLPCVLGKSAAKEFLSSFSSDPEGQLPLGFEFNERGYLQFPARVELLDVSPQILRLLDEEPARLRELSPDAFESLICNRLDVMGYEFERVGSSTYQKDGGVDIVAWPRLPIVPCLMAVQVKHTASSERKIGPAPVRELYGAIQLHSFNVGLLVTNTTFTPDARWAAQQHSLLMRLRDIDDLRRWLRNEFLQDHEWRELPKKIEVCPGVVVELPH